MSFACDELSDRIRDQLDPRLPITEKKMFGGRAFMLGGNMLVAVTKEGILMVRVGKEAMAQHLALPGAAQMSMGARTMAGFIQVSGDVLEDDDVLAQWIASARNFVGTLPPK
jgi:TfoX/Sxy family transcriptional regulator of competence genes